MGKIAYCIRPQYENGGDGIQVIKTREYLLDIHPELDIQIITSPDELTSDFELAHIFNYASTQITKCFFNKAKELGIPVVSSPIFWDYTYSIQPLPLNFKFYKTFISERYVLFYRFLNNFIAELPFKKIQIIYHNVTRKFRRDIKSFVEGSILILPNSEEEGRKCCDFAGLSSSEYRKIRVVFNGVDVKNVKVLPKEEFFLKYKIPENYILQVGRIEYLKNHLNLIQSMVNHPEIPIVIVGNTPGTAYIDKLKEVGGKRGNVHFVSGVPHEDIYSFYYYAKVHVLLSLRESPGLVSLEALSQSCPVVISDDRFLPVKTYFTDQYESVNPFDRKAIEEAVMKSYIKEHKPVDLSCFSWNHVAEQTYQAYKEVLRDA